MCWLYLLRILSLGNGPSLLHVVLVCLPTTDSPLLVNRRPSTGPKVSQFTSEAEALGLESSWSHHFQCLQDHKAPLALRCQHNLFWESLYFSCRTLKWMGEPLLGKFLWQVCLSLHVSRGLVRRRQWHPTPVLLMENPMDGGAWKAAVRGVAEGRTRMSDFTFTFHFHALEKEMAIHSSVLAWRIPGTGEPGGLLSMGLHRVGHDWSDLAAAEAWYTVSANKCLIKQVHTWKIT